MKVGDIVNGSRALLLEDCFKFQVASGVVDAFVVCVESPMPREFSCGVHPAGARTTGGWGFEAPPGLGAKGSHADSRGVALGEAARHERAPPLREIDPGFSAGGSRSSPEGSRYRAGKCTPHSARSDTAVH